MAAVTQQIQNYLGGVSRQSDDKKFPGQVKECLNGYPDPTFGLTKRPGFKWIKNLATGTPSDSLGKYTNAHWFYISRTAEEKYIGCIKLATGGGDEGIDIWNATSGTQCTVIYDASAWTASTAYALNDEVKNGSNQIYKCISAGTSAGSGGPTGTSSSITDGGVTWQYIKTSNSLSYLSAANRENYHVLTVQDTSIISNNQKTVSKLANNTFNGYRQATLLLDGSVQGGTDNYTVSIKIGSSTNTATYNSSAGDTYEDVLTGFKTQIENESISNLTVTKYQTHLQLTKSDGSFNVSGRGGVTNTKLKMFQDQAEAITDLPAQSFHDHSVKIINTTNPEDSYYVKFVADNGVDGVGHWTETIGHEQSPGFDASTMPHELLNTALNTFKFQQITWDERQAGDDTTNAFPSFESAAIERSFFYNNRLGFLSADNVILSQAGKFYNFFNTSAQTITDADPVDLSCATIRPTALHSVLPTAQGLVLFSQNQQFLMSSADGILKPSNTIVRSISNYEMDTVVDPVDMGTNINFISKTAGYTRIFGMVTKGQDDSPQVLDVGKVVNEWVPPTIDTLIASPQNQFIALSSQSSRYMYLFRTYSDGDKNIIESWFNWKLPGNIQFIKVENDDMYAITTQGTGANTQIVMSKANLSQSPDDAILISNDGQKLNPCMDLWSYARNSDNDATVAYDASNDFSKCYIPWNNVSDLTPVVLISGSTSTQNFSESGFTVTPEVITDDGDPYYKVPGKDLTSISTVNLTSKGSGYTSAPTVEFAGGGGSGATATTTLVSGSVASITITDKGTGYTSAPDVNLRPNKGAWAVSTAYVTNDQVSNSGNIYTLTSGNHTSTSGAPTHTSGTQTTGGGDWQYAGTVATATAVVSSESTVVGWKYNLDITLPKTYFRPDRNTTDYTANLSIARMKFAVGLSGNMNFKLKSTGVRQGKKEYTGDGTTTTFSWIDEDIDYTDSNQIKAKVNGIETTDFTVSGDTQITFTYPPANGDTVLIYLDEWYNLNPSIIANSYLANDIPVKNQSVFSIPIHQRTDNFQMRVFNDSPFPVALNGMSWEGNYSPRFYRRT